MVCPKCGNEIAANENFCSKCGEPIAQANASAVKSDGAQYTLTVNRANQWFAINPPVKIVIDNSSEYFIENDSSIEIPITAGAHTIVFSCNIRKRIVNLDVVSNCTLNMKWNRITGSLVVQ